ncbi:MAG: Uma2 family endonuclease [Gemmatimonadaceae bacterium]|nr:Uma2 family endonuclease [Gemmatimonadaceae bacterium]
MPTMSTRPERSVWTIEDLATLPDDGNRYELLHGELLVTSLPSNRHQSVAAALVHILYSWCLVHTGWAVRGPGGVEMSRTSWLMPDVALYPMPLHETADWSRIPPPTLVIEILSRSTRKRDRHRKRPAYLAFGVREVWTIDARHRLIEQWSATSEFPVAVDRSFTWGPDPTLPPIVFDFDLIFGASETR